MLQLVTKLSMVIILEDSFSEVSYLHPRKCKPEKGLKDDMLYFFFFVCVCLIDLGL